MRPPDADIFRVPIAPGAHLHVERYGFGGPSIVLLHGFATSSFLWRHVGPLLAVQGTSAYAIDLLGYGESDHPPDADFGLAAQAAYVDAAMTALHLTQATIVGVDLGALIALRLAFDRPDRAYRLVAIGPPPLHDIAGPEIRELQAETAKYALRLSAGMFGASALLRPFLEDGVAEKTNMPDALVGRYLAPYLGPEGASHLLVLAGALTSDDMADIELRRITQRVLILRGTRDRWCTRTVAEEYEAALLKGHYQHIDGVGHLVPEETSSDLARLISAFVQTAEMEESA